MHVRLLAATLLLLSLAAPAGAKKTAEDRLGGKIILSTKMFPRQFASDGAMVAHMKKAHTKAFRYDESGKIEVEFMAFFARPHTTTEFTGTIYDVTEGRQVAGTFPIYPAQKETRVLQSGMTLNRETYAAERRYLFVITNGYRGAVLAEANFVLQRPAGERDAKVEPTVVDMQ
ncbi:MAG: hypothetical protein KC549_08455 [Myxococcales bacterium]|nr:hypothetical protein [Myxococcales bacterium]MCB9546814.1 hypothetical protein [Myxococcales bacterium]